MSDNPSGLGHRPGCRQSQAEVHGKQQQEQNSPNLSKSFKPSPENMYSSSRLLIAVFDQQKLCE